MSHNLEYLLTRPGGLKIATIIFGIVASILCSHSYGVSPYTDYYEEKIRPSNSTLHVPGTELELSNMTSTFIILGISIIYLAAHALFYAIVESRFNRFMDVVFHICGALFLFAGGTTLIYSAVSIEQTGCEYYHLVSKGPTPKQQHFPLPTFLASTLHKIFQSSSPVSAISVPASSVHKISNSGGLTAEDEKICHYFGEKIVGGSLNLLNGLVYGFLAVIIHGTNLEDL